MSNMRPMTYEEVEKRAKEMFGDDMTWGAMDQTERNYWLKMAADELAERT